jgi:hypothetical protein
MRCFQYAARAAACRRSSTAGGLTPARLIRRRVRLTAASRPPKEEIFLPIVPCGSRDLGPDLSVSCTAARRADARARDMACRIAL